MKTRLEQFLIAENLTQAQFADSIQVARAAVSHILAGRNNPGYDFIVNMMKAYPDLNIEWLLNGKGEMYKGENHSPAEPSLFATQVEPAAVPTSPLLDEAVKLSDDVSSSATSSTIPNATSSTTLGNTPDNVIPSRHSTKIIVFYSDNSYEEFLPSDSRL